jgi:rhamnogalacturonyl hydrolase YesR
MAATTELLNYLPADHPKRSMIISLLQRHIVGVSRYQDVSGLWHQLLDKPDSYLESSCTAMFTYSIARAVNEGWIDKSYIAIAKNGWEGLSSRVNANGEVDSICVGTGVRTFIRHYYERPAQLNDIHGLGPVLLAGIEMIRAEK